MELQYEKHQNNAPGLFFVDLSCVDCDLCRTLAPGIFMRDDAEALTYVSKQPQDADEYALATEAMQQCPSESIGRSEEDSSDPGQKQNDRVHPE